MSASSIKAQERGVDTSVEAAALPGAPPPRLTVGESVTRGALALLSTQPFTWCASLLTTALAPRLLGADALGQLTIAVTVVSLVATAASLGVSEYLVRRVAQHPSTLRLDLGVALLLQTITAVVSAIAVGVLVPLVAPTFVDQRLLLIASLGLLFIPAQAVLSSCFRGRELHTQYAWFNAATATIGQIAGILVLLAGGGLLGYAATATVAIAITTLLGWMLSGQRVSLPPVRDGQLLRSVREMALGGFPFLTWSLILSITSGVDRVLLGLFVPAAEVGWYAAAYRIFAIPVFIPTLVITPLFPALSRSAHDPDTIRRIIVKTMRIVLLMTVPLSAGTIAVAPAIPAFLGWPADFENAVPLMALLSLQLPIVAIDMVFGVVLMAIGRQGRWAVVGLAAAALKILVNFVAIPVFENLSGNGAVGASIVTLLTELVMFAGAVVLIPKHLLDPRVIWDMVRIGLAGVATGMVGAALLPYALVLAVFGGAVTFVVVAVALKALTLDDAQLLRRRLVKVIPSRS